VPQDLFNMDDGVSQIRLSEADGAALDALIDAGLDVSKVSQVHRERAAATGLILGLLANDTQVDPLLTDVTLARIARAREGYFEGPQLSPMDEEAVDALALARFDAKATPKELQERTQKLAAIGELLTAGSERSPIDLVARTMAKVEAENKNYRAIPIERPGVFSRWKVGDFIGVAAALVICSAVVWPIISAARQNASKTACQSNMQTVANAMDSYAKTYRDNLPMATASLGGSWWDVGTGTSNSANLYTLARSGFAKVRDMACPGNPHAVHESQEGSRDWKNLDEVSYSYQIMFGPHRTTWSSKNPGKMVVMADRSPVVLRAVRHEAIYPEESSPNHKGYGQDALFIDGHVGWMTTPVLENGDNIWLPRPIEEIIRRVRAGETSGMLHGNELPEVNDVFLGP
jgi:hypothetical protein